MNGTCTCCGLNKSIQLHHPGRVKGFTVVPVCQDCHKVLTVWDGGRTSQRTWNIDAPSFIRYRVGIAEVIKLTAIRRGMAIDEVNQAITRFGSHFVHRVAVSDVGRKIDVIRSPHRREHAEAIREMMEGYLKCAIENS